VRSHEHVNFVVNRAERKSQHTQDEGATLAPQLVLRARGRLAGATDSRR
jgi:hypothetical protein